MNTESLNEIPEQTVASADGVEAVQTEGPRDPLVDGLVFLARFFGNPQSEVALVYGLATNPKTPQPTAMKFLNYLQDKDLRMVTKSRDVPSAISGQARRILVKKGKL